MTAKESQPPSRTTGNRPPPPASPAEQPPQRPWRTEGLPKSEPPKPKPRWITVAVWLLGYLLFFGILTVQDRLSGPQAVPYTEFKSQVASKNVGEVFARGDSIEGQLKKAAPASRPAGSHLSAVHDRAADIRERRSAGGADRRRRHGARDAARPAARLPHQPADLVRPDAAARRLLRLDVQAPAGRAAVGCWGATDRSASIPRRCASRSTMSPASTRWRPRSTRSSTSSKTPRSTAVSAPARRKACCWPGAPGTGKTLLARATAGEAKVPFFSASASEFIEMIVGVGASRVRELFAEARKVAPAIIFIDEIDTIGRARGGARAFGGHDEREQTLNQILTEMDGFSGHEGVVVLAATNRPDVLDPALLRPGRFDRQIVVHPPDHKGRVEILKVHTRKVPLAEDVDLERLAASTPGMTGADLANLVNEAALLAARRGQDVVHQRDLTDALEKVQLGTARNVVIPEAQRRRTAYHEAGHALLGMLQPGADPVRKVSIIPRGRALGVTLSTPESDRYGYDANYLRGRIIGALGGMAAEQEVFDVVTTGAESDLEMVTRIAPVDGRPMGHVRAHRHAVGAAGGRRSAHGRDLGRPARRRGRRGPPHHRRVLRRGAAAAQGEPRQARRDRRAAARPREPRRARDLRGGRHRPSG